MSTQDGRWWALGVVGALTVTALASGSRSGSRVRVGPRLQPKPVAWSPLRHTVASLLEPGSWPEEEDQIRILAGATHSLGTTDVSLPLIEGRVLWTSPGEDGFIQLLADDDYVNAVPTATRTFNLEQGMEEGMVEVHAPFSWRTALSGQPKIGLKGSPVRVGPRLRAPVPVRKPGELGRVKYTADSGGHRIMGLVAEPGRQPFWIWHKVDIVPSRHVYIAGWYSALAIRRVGTEADHAEAVRVFTSAVPGIVRDVYGPLWADSATRMDAPDVRPISRVTASGRKYGERQVPVVTQDYGVLLGSVYESDRLFTRCWPPLPLEQNAPEEWKKFREVDRRLQALGFKT